MACKHGLPKDWQYWQDYLKVMLPRCEEVWVVMIEGWASSVGILAEVQLAKELGKVVRFVWPNTVGDYDIRPRLEG